MTPAQITCVVLSVVILILFILLACRGNSSSRKRSTVAADQQQQQQEKQVVPPPAAFIAHPTFAGPKRGYEFKTGPSGTGYYYQAATAAEEHASPPTMVPPLMPPPKRPAPTLDMRDDMVMQQSRGAMSNSDIVSQRVARMRHSDAFWADDDNNGL